MGLVGLVSLCHRAFVDPKNFFVGILWVQNIFLWVFCEFHIFSCEYFVGPIFFLMGILWVQDFIIFNKL